MRPLRNEVMFITLNSTALFVGGMVPVGETSGPVWVALKRTSETTCSPIAIWFLISAVAVGNAVFQTLNDWRICALPLYLPVGSEISASSANGALSTSPLAMSLIHCLKVATLVATCDVTLVATIGLSCTRVMCPSFCCAHRTLNACK